MRRLKLIGGYSEVTHDATYQGQSYQTELLWLSGIFTNYFIIVITLMDNDQWIKLVGDYSGSWFW